MSTLASRMGQPTSLPGEKPWLSWAGLTAAISIAVGIYWDISWHETIGRDTFWTPAHLLIQFGALLAGLAAMWAILRATFQPGSPARSSSVNVFGFRGPLGAFVFAWGALAMLTSAPFDNWWHGAYGLDVKIISPPHLLLALGIAGINWGAILLAVAAMNRAEGARRSGLQFMVLVLGGLSLLQLMTVKLEYMNRVLLHSAISYLVISIGSLLILEALARATGHRWARTIVSGIYSLFVLLMMWVLPLFSAQPKLGPVYQNITHMVPLPFPILLIVPAFALDLMAPVFRNPQEWSKLSRAVMGGLAAVLAFLFLVLDIVLDAVFKQRRDAWNKWLQAAFAGITFLAILIAVEWPFATLLMSPAARHWFLAPNDFPYFAPPNSPTVRHVFVSWEINSTEFWRNMGLAFLSSVVSMRIGITFGNWLSRVKR
ncbi:MAG TPA: hypothetical protein VKE93_14645 [Candidatus Angelobacter sp.]|nr:hypothetical protein [Candidatus Angelobacter sp.]